MIDSQSVKPTESGGPRGYDAGKKINGRKRHIVTDTQGFLVGAVVHAADVQARDGAPDVLASIRCRFPWLRHVFDDGGYLSTVLDDFTRYIIAWKLCSTMRVEDVTDTFELALAASDCNCATVHHRPRLLSDKGPSYIASELAECIEAQRMSHVRGAPFYPQTQGKIER